MGQSVVRLLLLFCSTWGPVGSQLFLNPPGVHSIFASPRAKAAVESGGTFGGMGQPMLPWDSRSPPNKGIFLDLPASPRHAPASKQKQTTTSRTSTTPDTVETAQIGRVNFNISYGDLAGLVAQLGMGNNPGSSAPSPEVTDPVTDRQPNRAGSPDVNQRKSTPPGTQSKTYTNTDLRTSGQKPTVSRTSSIENSGYNRRYGPSNKQFTQNSNTASGAPGRNEASGKARSAQTSNPSSGSAQKPQSAQSFGMFNPAFGKTFGSNALGTWFSRSSGSARGIPTQNSQGSTLSKSKYNSNSGEGTQRNNHISALSAARPASSFNSPQRSSGGTQGPTLVGIRPIGTFGESVNSRNLAQDRALSTGNSNPPQRSFSTSWSSLKDGGTGYSVLPRNEPQVPAGERSQSQNNLRKYSQGVQKSRNTGTRVSGSLSESITNHPNEWEAEAIQPGRRFQPLQPSSQSSRGLSRLREIEESLTQPTQAPDVESERALPNNKNPGSILVPRSFLVIPKLRNMLSTLGLISESNGKQPPQLATATSVTTRAPVLAKPVFGSTSVSKISSKRVGQVSRPTVAPPQATPPIRQQLGGTGRVNQAKPTNSLTGASRRVNALGAAPASSQPTEECGPPGLRGVCCPSPSTCPSDLQLEDHNVCQWKSGSGGDAVCCLPHVCRDNSYGRGGL